MPITTIKPSAVIYHPRTGVPTRIITNPVPSDLDHVQAVAEMGRVKIPSGYSLRPIADWEPQPGIVQHEVAVELDEQKKSQLPGASLAVLDVFPSAISTPLWDTVDRARSVRLPPIKVTQTQMAGKKSLVGGDAQIGYRFIDGEWIPFHDERALDLFVQAAKITKPDEIVLVGDMIDLPSHSRWEQEPAFARTTQRSIDRLFFFLVALRTAVPNARIVWLLGNHEIRILTYIMLNAAAAHGLRRADAKSEFPVMTMEYLLRTEEIGVEVIDAYPVGAYWITPTLKAIHGTKANSRGSTVAAYLNENPHHSTLCGHIHRIELQSKTSEDSEGRLPSRGISPGALCRVDGAVPSVNGANGSKGKPAIKYENWQQGWGLVTVHDNGQDFFYQQVEILDGVFLYNGKLHVSEVEWQTETASVWVLPAAKVAKVKELTARRAA